MVLLGVHSKQMVSILVFLQFPQASFPFLPAWPIVTLMLLQEGAVCVKPLLTGRCASFCSEAQSLDWFAHGSVLAGDEYMWGLSYSPKGTLDTSPIRLPHTVVQTLVQIQSQLPGLGQRLFVKESQSLSVLARLRSRAFSPLKAVGINCPSILFTLNSSVCSFHFSYVFFEMLQVSEAPVLTALSDPTSALIFHPYLA